MNVVDDVDDTTIGRRNCVIVEATMVVINNNNIMIVVVVIVVVAAAVVGDYCKGTNLLFFIYVTLFLFPIAGIVEWSGSGYRLDQVEKGFFLLLLLFVACFFGYRYRVCRISWNDDVTTTSIKEIDVTIKGV